MRGVRELAEEPGHDEGRLLADVDGVVADALQSPGDYNHAETVLPHRGVAAQFENPLDDTAVGTVDELVEIDERFGTRRVSVAK